MKYFLSIIFALTLLPVQADSRIGKWCELADDANSCTGYISYFENGDVYAYGNFDDLLYIATGFWQQRDDQSCLNLTFKLFDIATEAPLPPEEDNFCNTVVAITAQTFTYLDSTGEAHTMRRLSTTPDYAMTPLPEALSQKQQASSPLPLVINAQIGHYAVVSLPLQTAPNQVQFTLDITPYPNDDNERQPPYAYVQIGDTESAHLRVSLHHKKTYGNKVTLLLEYHQAGATPQRQLLANDIEIGAPVDLTLAWQPDGETTLRYKDITVQHNLPLSDWQSYFIAVSAKARFQRRPDIGTRSEMH